MEQIDWGRDLRGYPTETTGSDTAPDRPNVFRIAGFPDREMVSSNVLAWLFDPAESHGLGPLVLGSLLALTGHDRAAATDARVETETTTSSGKRIDILAVMPGLAVAVENKVNAGLYNDLGDYRGSAAEAEPDGDAIVVVLSRNRIDYRPDSRREWGLTEGVDLFYVTYDELFDAILDGLGAAVMDADPRGVDLLTQYIDNYSPERNEKAMDDIDANIDRFTSRSEGLERQVIASRIDFDNYAKAVERKLDTLVEDTLRGLIDGAFEDPHGHPVTVSDVWHWPKRNPAYHSMTLHLEGKPDMSIELISATNPSHTDDWEQGDSPIANGDATFDSVIYKAYRETNGSHSYQRSNGRVYGVIEGARLSEPMEDLSEKVLQCYLSILEKAWDTKLSAR